MWEIITGLYRSGKPIEKFKNHLFITIAEVSL